MNVDEVITENDQKERKIPNVWQNPKLRITIWKLLLNYKKVNYEELKNKLDKEKIENINIIQLDTKRMIVKEGEDPTVVQNSLTKILSCLSLAHPKINYSQGMNYIAYFLYEICGSEEEAFQLFNCLLISTSYGDLFFDNLSRLNKYFYVFERLIFIYLPEISMHLKNKELTVRYFISPWFITLFTNALKNIKNQENPRVLKWIFDLFIIYGWKSILKIGLCLIKHFEIKILSFDLDELLHFLINDILKYEFFQNENYDNLRNIYEKLKIENALIENIENEYNLKTF
jgi:cytohesin/brefeldin A-inhibited guanine nucleotide-exchange protein